jgi:hypothetical protein
MFNIKDEMKFLFYLFSIDFVFFSGVGLSPLGTAAISGLLYKPQMIDEGECGAIGGTKIGRGNRSTRRKPAPAPLCPTWPDPGSNLGRRGGRSATNRLSYGAALLISLQYPMPIYFDAISWPVICQLDC